MAINIQDTQSSTLVPNMNLNQPIPMDLSSIKATVDSLTKNVAEFVAQYQKAGETKITPEPATPTKPSVLDTVLKRPEVQAVKPTKTAADYIKEQQDLRTAFLTSQGITQEDFDQRNALATQMASLNQQLQQMELQELKEKDDISRQVGVTTSFAQASINKLERDYLYKKALIATQGAGLAAQYQAKAGEIAEANNLFTQSINYATTKERQDVSDYQWALNYYTGIEESDRNYLQDQLDKKQALLKPELREVGGNLYQYNYNPDTNSYSSTLLTGGGAGTVPTTTDWTDLQIKTAIDGIISSRPDATYDEVIQEINSDPTIANKDRAIQLAKDKFGIKETTPKVATTPYNPQAAQVGKSVQTVGKLIGGGLQNLATFGGYGTEAVGAVASFFQGLFR